MLTNMDIYSYLYYAPISVFPQSWGGVGGKGAGLPMGIRLKLTITLIHKQIIAMAGYYACGAFILCLYLTVFI